MTIWKGPGVFGACPKCLIRNRICNSSVLARAEVVRSIALRTKIVLGFGDGLRWALLGQWGFFLCLDQSLTCYGVHHESKTTAFPRHELRHLFALLARLEEPLNAVRLFFSPCETIRLMIVDGLEDPVRHLYGYPPISTNPVVRLLLGLSKIVRSVGSVMSRSWDVHLLR